MFCKGWRPCYATILCWCCLPVKNIEYELVYDVVALIFHYYTENLYKAGSVAHQYDSWYVDLRFEGFWGGLVPANAYNASVLENLLAAGALGLKVRKTVLPILWCRQYLEWWQCIFCVAECLKLLAGKHWFMFSQEWSDCLFLLSNHPCPWSTSAHLLSQTAVNPTTIHCMLNLRGWHVKSWRYMLYTWQVFTWWNTIDTVVNRKLTLGAIVEVVHVSIRYRWLPSHQRKTDQGEQALTKFSLLCQMLFNWHMGLWRELCLNLHVSWSEIYERISKCISYITSFSCLLMDLPDTFLSTSYCTFTCDHSILFILS